MAVYRFTEVTETTFTISFAVIASSFCSNLSISTLRWLINRPSALGLWASIQLNPQKMQRKRQKTQAEENDTQHHLRAKRRVLRFIQPVVYPHESNQSDYLYYCTIDDNFIEKV